MNRDSLADNVVEELPASLCNLMQLKSLCLDDNQVKQVEQLSCDLFLHPLNFLMFTLIIPVKSRNIYGGFS